MFHALIARLRRWRMTTLKPFGPFPASVRVSLGDLQTEICERLAHAFAGVEAVEVVQGNLLDLDADAIVSPANRFGDMSGGIDKVIDDFHRGQAQQRIVEAIREQWLGELPVGAALIVELSGRRFPFVVAAPTMRIPGSVAGSINAYLAMRAALVAVWRYNAGASRPIRSLVVPGLGTGVGGISPREAAEQMRTAYDQIAGHQWPRVVHPALAPYAMVGVRLRERS